MIIITPLIKLLSFRIKNPHDSRERRRDRKSVRERKEKEMLPSLSLSSHSHPNHPFSSLPNES